MDNMTDSEKMTGFKTEFLKEFEEAKTDKDKLNAKTNYIRKVNELREAKRLKHLNDTEDFINSALTSITSSAKKRSTNELDYEADTPAYKKDTTVNDELKAEFTSTLNGIIPADETETQLLSGYTDNANQLLNISSPGPGLIGLLVNYNSQVNDESLNELSQELQNESSSSASTNASDSAPQSIASDIQETLTQLPSNLSVSSSDESARTRMEEESEGDTLTQLTSNISASSGYETNSRPGTQELLSQLLHNAGLLENALTKLPANANANANADADTTLHSNLQEAISRINSDSHVDPNYSDVANAVSEIVNNNLDGLVESSYHSEGDASPMDPNALPHPPPASHGSSQSSYYLSQSSSVDVSDAGSIRALFELICSALEHPVTGRTGSIVAGVASNAVRAGWYITKFLANLLRMTFTAAYNDRYIRTVLIFLILVVRHKSPFLRHFIDTGLREGLRALGITLNHLIGFDIQRIKLIAHGLIESIWSNIEARINALIENAADKIVDGTKELLKEFAVEVQGIVQAGITGAAQAELYRATRESFLSRMGNAFMSGAASGLGRTTAQNAMLTVMDNIAQSLGGGHLLTNGGGKRNNTNTRKSKPKKNYRKTQHKNKKKKITRRKHNKRHPKKRTRRTK